MSGVKVIRGSDVRDTRYCGTEGSHQDRAESFGVDDDGEVVRRRRLDGAIRGAIRFASAGRPDSIGF